MADVQHSALVGTSLHGPFQYEQDADPGAVGAGKYWLDTNSGPPRALYRRNAGNTAWDAIGTADSAIDHGGLGGLADDDHPQYQLRTEQGAANGYPDLDAGSKVPAAQLPTLDLIPDPVAAVTMNGQKITGLADPTSAQDAATRAWAEALVAATVTALSWKTVARAATTGNITLSGAQTIDGVSVIAGDRVLVKAQTTGSQNGIYVAAAGAWSRAADADSAAELLQAAVMISEGSTQADTFWQLTTNAPITVGTTSLVFQQFGTGVTDHGALTGLSDDDHPQYQLRTEKGVAGGYAGLDGGGTVPDAQLPAGLARDTEVTSAIGTHAGAADPHAGYQKESEKDQPGGYPSLGADGKVPLAELPASSGGPAAQGTYLVSGGQVTWTSGYVYHVAAGSGYIDGVPYSWLAQDITLDAADPTLDRIDVIAVNTSLTVVKITGEAATNPSEPTADPSTQLQLAIATVGAASTAPTVTTELVYANNAGSGGTPAEWNWTTSGSGFNVNSTTSPRTGTKSIVGTAVTAGSYAQGARGSGTFDPNGFTQLVLYLKLTSAWAAGRYLSIQLQLTGVKKGNALRILGGQFGLDAANTTDWQAVIIPTLQFAIPAGTQVNQVRVTDVGGSIGFQIDDVSFTTGGVTSTTGGLDLATADARYQLQSGKGAANGYASLDSGGTVPDAQLPAGLARDSEVTAAIATHAGLADPHTGYVLESLFDAAGDLLVGSADNTPAKLTKGSDGQVLTVDPITHLLVWATPAAGRAANPMTTSGDIIYGGASGVETRLPKGSDTQVLTLASGIPSWATPASGGMTNPMTTQDDVIIGGASGVAARLGKGSDGQVLTVDPTTHHLVWATPSSGTATDITVSSGALTTTEGKVVWDNVRKLLKLYDGTRERAMSAAGFVPTALAVGQSYTSAVGSSVGLAAAGGSVAFAVDVPGHMLFQLFQVRETSTSLARSIEWALYEDRNNASGTLDLIVGATGSDSWTASAGGTRTMNAASAPVYLGPGVYWAVVRNTHASNTATIGTMVGAANTPTAYTAQTKSGLSALGSTIDLTTGWTRSSTGGFAILSGRVFAQSNGFASPP